MKTRYMFALAVGVSLVTGGAFAHEGHDHGAPGALPAGSHGGKIVEAKVSSGKTASTDELFFEVVYRGKQVSIWPKLLQAANLKEFKDVSPTTLSKVELIGENGRTKAKKPLEAKVSETVIESEFELTGTSFGFLNVSVQHDGATKVARAQVSKR